MLQFQRNNTCQVSWQPWVIKPCKNISLNERLLPCKTFSTRNIQTEHHPQFEMKQKIFEHRKLPHSKKPIITTTNRWLSRQRRKAKKTKQNFPDRSRSLWSLAGLNTLIRARLWLSLVSSGHRRWSRSLNNKYKMQFIILI